MVIDRSFSIDITKRGNLFQIEEYLTGDQCDVMLRYVHENMERSFDRSTHDVNLGVNGDSGKYHSFLICREIDPVIWSEMFNGHEINGIPLDSVMVNVYKRGDFIPPHKDKQSSIYTVSIPLQTSQDSLVFGENPDDYYEPSGEDDNIVICKDVKGKGYGFYGNSPIHWVPEVTKDNRVTLICLYGAITY